MNHIEPQLENLISRDVSLPSGGSIRIDHTEALTVFDVNSAHYTGRSNKAEDLAFTVNKEAAHEICRQLRLRDIGGIIIVDFIDMKEVAYYLTKPVLEDLGNSIGRTISIVVNEQMSREGYSLMAVSD